MDAGSNPTLDHDESAAIRAFLQRSEVRLSTMHRVASALLSGAGLMVLLPAVERDSVVQLLRSLLTGDLSVVDGLLIVAIAMSLALPFVALWMVLRELTAFYFHSNHVQVNGEEVFTPRFTLTSLRLPEGELSRSVAARLDDVRREPRNVELLVPANDASRSRIDRQIDAYGGLGVDLQSGDEARAAALFELAAARSRPLLEEVAKVEHGMARHVLRTQVLVLRYVKALLALLTTALVAFAGAAVVEGKAELRPTDDVWLAAILSLWAPLVVIAVSTPVRWLDRLLRSEGARHVAVTRDPELTQIERIATRMALVAYIAAAAAMAISLAHDDTSPLARVAGAAATVTALVALVVAVRASRRRAAD